MRGIFLPAHLAAFCRRTFQQGDAMSADEKLILDAGGIERALARIAHEIVERNQGISHL